MLSIPEVVELALARERSRYVKRRRTGIEGGLIGRGAPLSVSVSVGLAGGCQRRRLVYSQDAGLKLRTTPAKVEPAVGDIAPPAEKLFDLDAPAVQP
jgi:hypothetical protein